MATPLDLSSAASLEQQAYLVALALQQAELLIAPETRPNNTQISFDTEAATTSISISLTTVLTVEDGKAVIAATTYLA
jgi:hypothetical protein